MTARADCGHTYPLPGPSGGASGYAVDVDGRTMCYGCSDSQAAATMNAAHDAGVPFTAYVSGDGRTITTWPGGVLARITLAAASRDGRFVSYRATDADGRRWYGRGAGRGMVITLRPAR